MTSLHPPQARTLSTRTRITLAFGVLLLTLLITGFVAGAAALRFLDPRPETSSVRDALLTGLEMSRVSSVEITIPTWAAALGRVGASLANTEPQVKAALQTLHGGQIGIYEVAEKPSRNHRLAMLDISDTRLESDGWSRMVTVLDDDELIAVYGLDSKMSPDKPIEVFVLVMVDKNLVIVSASGYAEPLFELASSAIEERHR